MESKYCARTNLTVGMNEFLGVIEDITLLIWSPQFSQLIHSHKYARDATQFSNIIEMPKNTSKLLFHKIYSTTKLNWPKHLNHTHKTTHIHTPDTTPTPLKSFLLMFSILPSANNLPKGSWHVSQQKIPCWRRSDTVFDDWIIGEIAHEFTVLERSPHEIRM